MLRNTAGYDAIFLSPHLDDVALSCGGRVYELAQSGARVLIATVTAGTPARAPSSFAQFQHTQWSLVEDAVAARRQEDKAACGILGAEWLHWDELDCIYRHDPVTGDPFYQSDADLFGAVASADAPLIARLADRIAALPAHDILFAPLGLGNHVDHQLTRAAAERAHIADGARLLYYEDYPYAQQTARFGTGKTARAQLTAHLFPLSVAAVTARIAAIVAYTSQLAMLFGSAETVAAQIEAFVSATGGERYWERSDP